MNNLLPRQRPDGRWDMTALVAGDIRAVGYCCPESHEHVEEVRAHYGLHDDGTLGRSHHWQGHATPGEARECYRQYLLDHELDLSLFSHKPSLCQVCFRATERYAKIGNFAYFELCEEHLTREYVEGLFDVQYLPGREQPL